MENELGSFSCFTIEIAYSNFISYGAQTPCLFVSRWKMWKLQENEHVPGKSLTSDWFVVIVIEKIFVVVLWIENFDWIFKKNLIYNNYITICRSVRSPYSSCRVLLRRSSELVADRQDLAFLLKWGDKEPIEFWMRNLFFDNTTIFT